MSDGYDAFLSYSRTDGDVARRLQQGLERIGSRRSELPVVSMFRDETDLPPSSSLIDSIAEQMAESRSVILLCSPRSAGSRFVGEELELWRQLADSPPILVRTDGDLTWNNETGRFDTARSSAMHPAAVGWWDAEPSWIDWPTRPSGSQRKRLTDEERSAVEEVAAAVLGRPLREIRNVEVRNRRRQLWITRIVAAIVAVLAAVAVVAFSQARQNAEEATQQADLATSTALGVTARQVFETDPVVAMLLAVEAATFADTAEARAALFEVGVRAGQLGQTRQANPLGRPDKVAVDSDGQLLFVSYLGERTVEVIEPTDRGRLPVGTGIELPSPPLGIGYRAADDRFLSVGFGGDFNVFDGQTGRFEQSSVALPAGLGAAVFSQDGEYFAVVDPETVSMVTFGSTRDPASATTVNAATIEHLAISNRGIAGTVRQGTISLWAAGQQTPAAEWFDPAVFTIGFASTGSVLGAGGVDGRLRTYDVDAALESESATPSFGLSRPAFALFDIAGQGHRGSIVDIAAGPGGAFWTAGNDGVLVGWSPRGLPVIDYELAHGGGTVALAAAERGQVSVGANGSVQWRDDDLGRVIHRDARIERFINVADRSGLGSATVLVAGNGALLEVGGDADEISEVDIGGLLDPVVWTAMDATDQFIAVGAGTGQVEVRNREDGRLIGRTTRTAPVSYVEIVGDELLVGDRAIPELARLTLDETLTQIGSLTNPDAPAVFANNFGIFAGAAAEDGGTVAAAYGPFGDVFFQRRNGAVESVRLGDGRTGIQNLSISPDETTLAVVRGGTGAVELWDLDALDQQGRALDTLFGQTLVIGFIDAETLVVGGTGGWLQLWDVGTGESIGSPVRAHDSDLVGVTIDRDQRSMLTTSTSSVVWWNLDERNWRLRLCLAAGRPLSEEEWQRFLPDRPYRRTCDSVVAD